MASAIRLLPALWLPRPRATLSSWHRDRAIVMTLLSSYWMEYTALGRVLEPR